MSANDEAARKARAQQIREQIKQLKTSPANSERPEEENPPSRSKNYRDLIHERMHELDKDKKEGS
jgi:hypothetical protein